MYSLKNKKRKKIAKKRVLIAVGFLLIVGVILAILELTDTINVFTNKPINQESIVGPNTKGEGATGTSTSDNANSSDQTSNSNNSNDKNGNSNTSQNLPLLEPSGTFVSNHEPNLSGDPSPNLIQSVCVTTPGANCTISFTKNGESKSLPEKKTDREGAAYWDWKLQDIGLTTGDWRIQARATLNGEEKTTNDSLTMKVRQ